MTHATELDEDLLRDILRDAYEASEIERLTVQEGWTLRDFEARLRDDGFLDDLAAQEPASLNQIVYYNGERYEM